MPSPLEAGFEREMWRLYEEPKKRFRYNASYFLRMLTERPPIDVARTLVLEPKYHDGLTFLWDKGALDLSVVALVLRRPWRELFEPEVLESARRKLRDLGYKGPELDA